ncbi:MAG: hypothetical protein JST01_16600 [Cyanobacteria bacterium SZAS TMP-1]|nr:hypothetical protein [Cyanobacteria bacterium SZAS TMP-1]
MDKKNRAALLEAPSLYDEHETDEKQQHESAEPIDLNAAATKSQKDIWDKIGALAPIISGMLIFVMGGYFTYSYNQQQLRLQEIQTIEKFIPHLMGNDQSKRAAILAIQSLTNAELAGKFAQIFASKGTVSALQSMAENGSESEKSAASTALAKALENIAARESKLNEMETAFQQALNEKNSGSASPELNGSQIEEADRLEHLADMCRGRGQLPVAESLLKQAVNIRVRVQLPSGASAVIATLKKLSEVEQAVGNKEEAEGTLKKIALIETKLGQNGSGGPASPPPPPPPAHETTMQNSKPARAEKAESESAKEKEAQPNAEPESKAEKEAGAGEAHGAEPNAPES